MNRLLLLSIFVAAGAAGQAQTAIPVRLEPRHHNVFENAQVRILDVRIPPHDTSLMHKHELPSVFIVLGNTRTGSQVLIEPKQANFSHASIWFESFASSPRIHRVWNSDTSMFHTVDMELLSKHPGVIDPPLKREGVELLFDEAPVRGYRIRVPARSSVEIPGRKAALVLIGLSDHPGSYLFSAAGKPLTIRNDKAAPQEFALFEIK